MKSFIRSMIVIALLWLLLRAAYAERSILVVDEAKGAQLETLLREIRLHVDAVVSVEAAPEAVTSTPRIAERASELLEQRRVQLVVWISAIKPGDPVVVHVVGPVADRAILEVVRVPIGASELDAHREVALRVASLLDTVMAQPATAIIGIEPPPTPPPTPPHVVQRRWTIGTFGELMIRDGDRGAHPALGLSVARDIHTHARVGVRTRWAPVVEIEGVASDMTLWELGAMLEAAFVLPYRSWELLGALSLGGSLLRARAVSGERVGRTFATAPLAGVGIGAKLELRSVQVAATLCAEGWLFDERFLVEGQVVARTGHLRGIASVGLVIPLP
jgi:hypothetical protein